MNDPKIMYPNVTSIPGSTSGVGSPERSLKKPQGTTSEFDKVFDKTIGQSLKEAQKGVDLNQVKSPLKFSAHASQRLQDRKIQLDAGTMMKVSEAIDRAEAKGVEDTLVLTKDAALIVSVKNRTVITAMDRSSLAGNVFTNIDGAVIV